VCASDCPICLFKMAARVSASGPNCTLPTPTASEVCNGWRRCTRRWQLRQRPTAISKRRTGPPHNLFLVLRLAAFRLHAAAATWAALRQRNHDHDLFIHPRWGGAASLVGRSGILAYGAAAVGWPLVCHQNEARLDACWRVTLLPTAGADVRFPVSGLDLFAQPQVLLLRSIQIPFRNKLDALRLTVCSGPANWSHPILR